MPRIIFCILFLANIYSYSFAAVGCSLNDPDRDVKRLFPESSGYRTTFVALKEIGGEALQKEIEEKLGDKFDPVYENLDVPYAYYTVLKGKEAIGVIHGVNQKGKYGSLQLVLATDLEGKILEFYYQRISSPESGEFIDKSFTKQFSGMSLADFYNQARISQIADPSKNNHEDFTATLRGIKKNLILLEVFIKEKKQDNQAQNKRGEEK